MNESIDIQALSELSGGDEEFVKEILNLFIENTPLELNKMRSHLEKHETKELAEALHKMKSFSAPLGLNEMRTKIYSLEEKLKSNDLSAVKTEMNDFFLFMEDLVQRTEVQIDKLNLEN